MEKVKLSDSEWTIMQAIWKSGEITVGELTREVAHIASWSRYTVISFLNRMLKKRAIEELPGRPRKYRALLDRASAVRAETKEALDKVYGGDVMLMVTSAVDASDMSDAEISELIDILKRQVK